MKSLILQRTVFNFIRLILSCRAQGKVTRPIARGYAKGSSPFEILGPLWHNQGRGKRRPVQRSMQVSMPPEEQEPLLQSINTSATFEALAALYQSTSGSKNQWRNSARWMIGNPCDYPHWHGLRCDAFDRIITLDLSLNKLNGSIPTEFGLMPAMVGWMDLQSNGITGSLPTELGQLTNMKGFMGLYLNKITGSLPSQLGKLSAMTVGLDVHHNDLSGSLPSQLGLLSAMTFNFEIYNNKISGSLPSQLGRMTSMTYDFTTNFNKITGRLPSQLGQLSKLIYSFSIVDNDITGTLPR